MKRAWIAPPLLVLAAVAIWRPPAGPAIAVSTASPAPARQRSFGKLRMAPGAKIVVYVVGAVKRAGLYTLRDGERVDAALRAAGGFAPGADPAGVNLAARAMDGDEIDVPLAGQVAQRLAARAKLTRGEHSARIPKTIAAVNVNDADEASLQRVPGIGATLAARIIDVRAHDGPFSSYDQLLDVAGMTQARLDRAQPYLRL